MRRIAVLLIIVFFFPGIASGQAPSTGEAYVIGRITGIQRELPGYFYNNMHLHMSGIDRVEFPGFRLLRVEDGRKFLIRPNHEGYFYQALPGGKYTLTRKRNDRPDYRQPKTIEIMSFVVHSGSLVNLGTINIVLEGKPVERLFDLGNTARGKYIYSYHYERDYAENAYSRPLNWFAEKKPEIVAGFGEQVVREDSAPTSEGDGSRVVLRDSRRFHN